MKLKFFTDKSDKSNKVEALLEELKVDYEKINIKTQKGKVAAKEWVVNSRSVPFLYFLSNNEDRIYYATNIKLDKYELKHLIKDVEKEDKNRTGLKKPIEVQESKESELW